VKLRFIVNSSLFCLLLLGGCATSRSIIDIKTPTENQPAQTNGRDVYISSTTDRRIFEVNPSSPNTPSLNPSEDQSDKVKLRSIARKRNTFGKALGDILLQEGQSVESLTTASIRQAFAQKGYRIIDNKDKITDSTYIVDTDITKFWSWMNPGFLAITLSTEISTDIRIKSHQGTDRQTVNVKSTDNFQTGVDGNWEKVVNMALKSYVSDLETKIK